LRSEAEIAEVQALDRSGLKTISIARRADVAFLDEFIGPKY
jgi:hypothetical protein